MNKFRFLSQVLRDADVIVFLVGASVFKTTSNRKSYSFFFGSTYRNECSWHPLRIEDSTSLHLKRASFFPPQHRPR